MAGKFTNYAENFGVNMEQILNRAILRTVEKGLKMMLASEELHANTGRSLYHWIIIPGEGSGQRPGSRRLANFDWEVRGNGIVPERTGRGTTTLNDASRRRIEQHVLTREVNQVLRRGLKGSKLAKGKGTRTFAFYNATPTEKTENDGPNQKPYAVYANTQEAQRAAIDVMRAELAGMLARENKRDVRARYR